MPRLDLVKNAVTMLHVQKLELLDAAKTLVAAKKVKTLKCEMLIKYCKVSNVTSEVMCLINELVEEVRSK